MPDDLIVQIVTQAPTVGALLWIVYRGQRREDELTLAVTKLAAACANCMEDMLDR